MEIVRAVFERFEFFMERSGEKNNCINCRKFFATLKNPKGSPITFFGTMRVKNLFFIFFKTLTSPKGPPYDILKERKPKGFLVLQSWYYEISNVIIFSRRFMK